MGNALKYQHKVAKVADSSPGFAGRADFAKLILEQKVRQNWNINQELFSTFFIIQKHFQ